MGQRTKNAIAVFSDSKARGIIIILIILVIVAFVIGYFKLRSTGTAGIAAGAALPSTPSNIRAVPGVGEPSREYIKLQEQQNVQQAEQALQTGKSAVPTLTRVTYVNTNNLTSDEVTKAGCSIAEITQAKAAGASALDLRCRGCSLSALKAAGFTAADLAAAGFTAKELYNAGFSIKDLKDANFSAKSLKELGVNIQDLVDAGFNARELREAGFSATELREAKLDVQTLRDAGFNATELHDAGFGAKELNVTGYSPAALSEAGFTKAELGNAGIALPTTLQAAPQNWEDTLSNARKNTSQQLSKQEYADRLRQIQQSMNTQATEVMTSWVPITQQQYAAASEESSAQGGTLPTGSEAPGAPSSQAQVPIGGDIYKAGTILFAVLDTGINSDEQSPILATIVQQGRLKNAKVLGQFQRVEKKVVLQFNMMNVPSIANSVPINAVAIDQYTARTALASKVNNHYMLRYGTLFASSFVSGLAQAIQTSGSESQQNINGSQSNFFPKLDPGQKALVALGNVGQQFGSLLSPMFSRPPTVEVKAGSPIGILLMADTALPSAAAS